MVRGVYPPYTLSGPATKKTLFVCVSSLKKLLQNIVRGGAIETLGKVKICDPIKQNKEYVYLGEGFKKFAAIFMNTLI